MYSNVKDIEDETNALVVARDALDALFTTSARAFSWKPLTVFIRAGDLPKRASCEILPVMIDGKGPGGGDVDDDDEDDAENVFAQTIAGERRRSDATESASVYRKSKFMRCVVAARASDESGVSDMFQHLRHRLHEAELTMRDLAHGRMYRAVSDDAQRSPNASPETTFNALVRASRADEGINAPFLVDAIPTHACGLDVNVDAAVVLEAYAVRWAS